MDVGFFEGALLAFEKLHYTINIDKSYPWQSCIL